MKRTKMDEIVENMANYICDHICQKPKEITDQEKLEDYCAEECEMRQHFCNILNQYNEINNFEESELCKIMTKYQEITLCKECKYRVYEKETDLTWRHLTNSLGGLLEETDGCSRGTKVSESDTSK